LVNFRNVPGSAFYFFALSEIREILAKTRGTWQPILNKSGANGLPTAEHQRWENLFSGSAARGAVGYVMMPITVVKVRYEVKKKTITSAIAQLNMNSCKTLE
jgi:solute carrier family 25 protein 38